MKTRRSQTARHRSRGFSLIECLTYLSVSVVILGLATMAFYRCWDASVGLRRNAEDIACTLMAGERWREDMRSATAPPRLETSEDGQVLHIPHAAGEVIYRFTPDAVLRQADANAPWGDVFGRVKSCHVTLDQRQHVSAWRLELELLVYRKGARTRPLFSFEAVVNQVTRQRTCASPIVT